MMGEVKDIRKRKIIVRTLINNRLGTKRDNGSGNKSQHIHEKYQQYVYDSFDAFCLHKRQLVLNLFQLNEHFKELKALIIDDSNLISDDLRRLFPNVSKIIIYATKRNGKKSQKFDISKFLQRIPTDINGLIVIVKATRHQWNQKKESWLLEKFKALKMELTQTKDDQNLIEDCLIIQC